MGHSVMGIMLVLHDVAHVMLSHSKATGMGVIALMWLLLMACPTLPHQAAVSLIVISIVVAHITNHVTVTVGAVSTIATADATTVL